MISEKQFLFINLGRVIRPSPNNLEFISEKHYQQMESQQDCRQSSQERASQQHLTKVRPFNGSIKKQNKWVTSHDQYVFTNLCSKQQD